MGIDGRYRVGQPVSFDRPILIPWVKKNIYTFFQENRFENIEKSTPWIPILPIPVFEFRF